MKKTIKIAIVDFAYNEGHLVKKLLGLLSDRYRFVLTENDPEYILHSCFGRQVLKYHGVRIFYSAENVTPDFNISDYAIGMHHLQFEDRYYRLPLYRMNDATYQSLFRPRWSEDFLSRDFCTCVVSNSNRDPNFDRFFQALSRHHPVLSGGRLYNNVGGPVTDKIEFTRKGKFALAFENSVTNGYITEKITDAFAAGCIPIYYGAKDIIEEFNPKSFINLSAFDNHDEAIRETLRIFHSHAKCKAMLQEPVFLENREPEHLQLSSIHNFFSTIFDVKLDDAYRRNRIAMGQHYENRMHTAFFKPLSQFTHNYRDKIRAIRKHKSFTPPNMD